MEVDFIIGFSIDISIVLTIDVRSEPKWSLGCLGNGVATLSCCWSPGYTRRAIALRAFIGVHIAIRGFAVRVPQPFLNAH